MMTIRSTNDDHPTKVQKYKIPVVEESEEGNKFRNRWAIFHFFNPPSPPTSLEKVVSCLLELMYYNLWFVRGIKSNPQRVANKDLNGPHTTIRSLSLATRDYRCFNLSFKHQQFKTKCSLFSDFWTKKV